jgi:branched-chain amino acid transport system permease protein
MNMISPDILVQLVINGLLLAGTYALMALGLNVIFGVIRVLNMAHGEFLMLGGFAVFWGWQLAGLNPLLGLIVAMPPFFAAGYLFQHVIVRRLMSARTVAIEDNSLLLTYGLSLALVALARFLWTANYRSIPVMRGSFIFGDLIFSYSLLIAFAAAIALTGFVFLFLRMTRTGMAIRATAQNLELASACGVETQRVYAVAFGIGTAVAAAAGGLMVMMFAIYPDMGLDYTIRAFVIVILGGMGSMVGVLIGSVVLGITESIGSFAFGSLTATIIPFGFILLILLVRPSGISAKAERAS